MLAPLALVLTLVAGVPRFALPPSGGEERLEYLYDLTTTTGKVTVPWPALAADPDTHEVFLMFAGQVRVFNPSGVEIYRFSAGGEQGYPLQVLAGRDGETLITFYGGARRRVVRFDFRGRPDGELTISNLPPELKDFEWVSVLRAADRLYFFDPSRFRVVVTDMEGAFVAVREAKQPVLEDDEGAREAGAPASASERRPSQNDRDIRGFSVDAKGTLYLGFPMLFQVAVIAPDGSVRGFGQKGSTAGKFNIIADVTADEDGYIYVADILKGAVLVFDPQFQFVGQVNGLGAPSGLLCADGKLYVTQGGKLGIAVFKVKRRPPPPPPPAQPAKPAPPTQPAKPAQPQPKPQRGGAAG